MLLVPLIFVNAMSAELSPPPPPPPPTLIFPTCGTLATPDALADAPHNFGAADFDAK